ncbi:MAG: divalent-cation tolerance protein CutA [Burkholderiales bacterium]
MEEAILVVTTLPDANSAAQLGRMLVELKLAACVTQLPPCTSIYRWQGEIETAEEIPLLIKTLRRHYGKIEQAIRQHHPYELPEIMAVTIADGLPGYLAWVAAATIR